MPPHSRQCAGIVCGAATVASTRSGCARPSPARCGHSGMDAARMRRIGPPSLSGSSIRLERDLTGATSQGTALRAIRKRCIDCSGNSDVEARSCNFGPDHSAPCSLHPYRLGRNPNIKRSDEWKRAAAERLALARAVALPKNPIETPDLSGDQKPEVGLARSGASEKSPHAL